MLCKQASLHVGWRQVLFLKADSEDHLASQNILPQLHMSQDFHNSAT